MAGGVGSRFWPVSTTEYPKQFHDMLGAGSSLLQKTFGRLSRFVPPDQILILTNARYQNLVLEQLPEGSVFRMYNGRIFKKGPKKIKRYQCIEVATGKLYLFQPQAEVELLTEEWDSRQ